MAVVTNGPGGCGKIRAVGKLWDPEVLASDVSLGAGRFQGAAGRSAHGEYIRAQCKSVMTKESKEKAARWRDVAALRTGISSFRTRLSKSGIRESGVLFMQPYGLQ